MTVLVPVAPKVPEANSASSYSKTREILLENFETKAIAEFASGTFGATGTSTVILFLQKRSADFKKDRKYISEDLFNGVKRKRKLEHIDSAMLLQKYISYREVDLEDYQSLLKKKANEKIKQTDFWQEYQDWFDNLTEIKNLKEQNQFLKLIEQEKDQKLELLFYQKILKKEQEKFYFFMLSFDNNHKPQKTILVKTGEKNPAKAFIGYDFSTRKGSEGIKIFRDSQGNPTTKLYDDKNHNNPEKASSYILKNFWNEEITEINKNIAEHISIANLTEMLDFSLVEFNKTISLNPKKDITVESRWEMVKLESIVKIIRGVIYNKNEEIITPTSNIILTADNITLKGEFELKKQIFLDNSVQLDSEKKLIKDDIFICFASGSKEHIGKLTYIKNNTKYYAGGFMGILRGENSNLLTKYLFDLLNLEKYRNIVRSTSTGSNINNLSNTIGDIKIPLPPVEIQQKIVDECEAVDNEVEQSRQTITTAKQQIEQKVRTVMNAGYEIR